MKKRRFLSILLVMTLIISCLPGELGKKAGVVGEVKAEEVTLQNPRIEPDESMEAGQRVTYDCVWFGSYPQTEIVNDARVCGSYGKTWGDNTDYVINQSLYLSLLNLPESHWNESGDTTISGTKYRRLKSENATYYSAESSNYHYNWNNYKGYHYFRYEPIKWRILNISEDKAFLMADRVLDNQKFNAVSDMLTWSQSTIRSWLNGYGSTENTRKIDYKNNSFYDFAFNDNERENILFSYLEDYKANDKVFLLSEKELSTAIFGFTYMYDYRYDEAKRRKSTTYAKAMGETSAITEGYVGNTSYWQRSYQDAGLNQTVNDRGEVSCDDNTEHLGVCPAIRIGESYLRSLKYAGTVGTDGKVIEPESGSNPDSQPVNSQIITASNKTIAINSKPISLGTKTNGNGKLTYSSSVRSVATVSSSGIITPKNYGATTITIKAAETSTYKSAKKTITVTVVPKKMTLTTVKSPAKKTLLLKWKKDPAATKYEIQLCMKSSFKKNTLSRVYAKKILKKKIKNMKSKTWYVRIRAWKKVRGKIYKGVWSKVKKVKVK